VKLSHARIALLALVLCPRLALAQAAVADQEAEAQFRLGMQAVASGRAEEARIHFQEAYAIDPKSGTLKNLGLAESNLPEYKVLAISHLRRWLRDGKRKPQERDVVLEVLRELKAATGHVTVDGAPAAATRALLIDGNDANSVEQEGGVFDVLPGHHVIVANAGTQSQTREVDVSAGASVTVRFDPAASPPGASGAAPRDTIATTPIEQSAPNDSSSARTWATIGLGGGAVVLFATGLYFGAKSSGAYNDAVRARSGTDRSTCALATTAACSSIGDSASTARTDHTVSVVLVTGGGLMAAGAIASWILMPKGDEKRSVTPIVGSGVFGAQWLETF
jgi:hypothetical protein